MRILVTNDDGIEAPGLELLAGAARRLSEDVWIVAPAGNRSSIGHGITMRRPFSIIQVEDRRFSCSGTPADCVIAAVTWLFADQARPDLVLSGINEGLNVAEDVAYSGTIAAAREAAFWGIPAASLARPKGLGPYGPTELDWLAGVLDRFWQTRPRWATEGHWLNVNLPAAVPAALREARLGRDKVAKAVTVLRRDGAETTLQTVSGRDATATNGDENFLTQTGYVSVTNLHWLGFSRLAPGVLDGGRRRTGALEASRSRPGRRPPRAG